MASSIPSILGRKVLLPALATAASFATVRPSSSSSGVVGGTGRGRRSGSDEDGDHRRDAPPPSSSDDDDTTTTTTTTKASCEATTTTPSHAGRPGIVRNDAAVVNPFLAPGPLRETVLRKRMTAVGRFSLKSETNDNRSIPVFFLALC